MPGRGRRRPVRGHEFVVLVRGASTARAIGERLLERVRGYDWAPLTGGRPVTLSVGVSEGRDLAGALRASDAAMLRAKRAGRDGLVHVVLRAPAPRTEHARYPPVAPGAWPLTVVPDPLPATVATTMAGPPAVVAEFGLFDLLAYWAHELYVAGPGREALRACAAGLLVTEPAGDRETSRFLRYVGCLVHAQQGHWSRLRRATEDHLDTLDPNCWALLAGEVPRPARDGPGVPRPAGGGDRQPGRGPRSRLRSLAGPTTGRPP